MNKEIYLKLDESNFIKLTKHKLLSTLSLDDTTSFLLKNIDCVMIRNVLWDNDGEIRELLEQNKKEKERPLEFSKVAEIFFEKQ